MSNDTQTSRDDGRRWLVTVDEDGGVALPDELWETSVLAHADRFDLLVGDDGVLVLRACPLSYEAFTAHGPGHFGEPGYTDDSVCGLTKWVCAGCGAPTIVEHCDRFPTGWLEVRACKADGDTLAYEAVCSRACLGRLATSGRPLRAVHVPGFAPPVDAESSDDELSDAEPSDVESSDASDTTTGSMASFADMVARARQSREAYRELERLAYGREWTVSDLFTGMIGDVGDLAQLLGAREGIRPGPDNLDAHIAHELADVLWSVLVIADEVGIDLDSAFAELHETLMERIGRKLGELAAGDGA